MTDSKASLDDKSSRMLKPPAPTLGFLMLEWRRSRTLSKGLS